MIRAITMLAFAMLAGCAVTVDALYHLAGPNGRSSHRGPQLATGRVDGWREISFDHEGLICRDVESPWMRSPRVSTAVVNPNGWKAAMQVLTVLEAVVVAGIVGGKELSCAKGDVGCTAKERWDFHKWFLPLAADLAWGTYRSLTIHDEILRSNHVSWGGPMPGERIAGISDPCGAGTDVTLYGGGEEIVIHIREGGRSSALQLPELAAFLAAHVEFEIAGQDVELNRAGAIAIVDATRAAAMAATTRSPAAVTPNLPALPSGITLQLDIELPIPVPIVVQPRSNLDHRDRR